MMTRMISTELPSFFEATLIVYVIAVVFAVNAIKDLGKPKSED